VLGATNADLSSFVRQGKFRQDLLYRLDVLTLDVPPLRDRGDDALVLARAFLRKLCGRYQQPERTFHADAIAALRSYEWPGNVRELENLLHREFLLEDGNELMLPGLPRSGGLERRLAARRSTDATGNGAAGSGVPAARVIADGVAFRDAKARVIADFEREYLQHLLRQSGGNLSLAARLAGKERSRFNRLVRKHRLCARDFRAPPGSRGS